MDYIILSSRGFVRQGVKRREKEKRRKLKKVQIDI
jgi:hypothetical protein